MTTVPHEAPVVRRRLELLPAEVWASVAIVAIWLAVLFTAIWGPSIVSTTAGGTNSSVPSVVVVALFAALATWPVAKHGFRRGA